MTCDMKLPLKTRLTTVCVAVFTIAIASRILCAADGSAGKPVVLWISVDGMRGDYVDRGQTPFLQSLMAHGEYTKQLTPIFPSLTFPSHVSEATGVAAGVHGIVSNKFKDTSIGQEFNMPSDPNMLQAEPIWLTATRQNVRTAVMDWPLSDAEDKLPSASPRAAFYSPAFDAKLSDYDRLEKLVDVYRNSFNNANPTEPLQLLMGYVYAVDHAGHQFGPEASATTNAVHEEDQVLEKIVNQVADVFHQHMHPDQGDTLYVLITTDHGMDTVKTLVNARKLIGGSDVPDSVVIDTSGSLANIYLNDVPGPQRDEVRRTILDHLKQSPFLEYWTREELPAKFAYANNNRTGDIVVNLSADYDFNSHIDGVTAPADSDPKSLKGMHGYDPAEDQRMLGFAVLSRWGSDQSGHDLGPVSTLRLHPTVAKLLGIQPAAGAKAQPLDLPQ
jgi:predicted AlkP superfamily pyrophosphatase or phosphodiesterase